MPSEGWGFLEYSTKSSLFGGHLNIWLRAQWSDARGWTEFKATCRGAIVLFDKVWASLLRDTVAKHPVRPLALSKLANVRFYTAHT